LGRESDEDTYNMKLIVSALSRAGKCKTEDLRPCGALCRIGYDLMAAAGITSIWHGPHVTEQKPR
jgi:hypothetical protein